MSGEIMIGLISLGVLVIVNIMVVAFGYGRLTELVKSTKDSMDAHCKQNEIDRIEELKRIERLEAIVFNGIK